MILIKNIAAVYGCYQTTVTNINLTTGSTPLMILVEVLGKKFEVSEDTFQKLYLAEIDFHGILFYKSLKKNSILIEDRNVKEYLENLLQIEERDDKIKEIMKNL